MGGFGEGSRFWGVLVEQGALWKLLEGVSPTPNQFRISRVNGLSGGQADGQHLRLLERMEGSGVSQFWGSQLSGAPHGSLHEGVSPHLFPPQTYLGSPGSMG